MSATDLLLWLVGLAVGAGLASLLTRGRAAATIAALAAERDAVRRDADVLRVERDDARRRADDAARQQAAARAEAAGLAATLRSEREGAERRVSDLREQHEQLAARFRSVSGEVLAQSSQQFLELAEQRFARAQAAATTDLDQRRQAVEHLVSPLNETLGKVQTQLRELEQSRLEAYTKLTEQVGFVRATSEQLQAETAALVTALRAPQTRGRWGEMQLRRVVEMAGMVEHCDFDEQASSRTDDGLLRPDMVVRLAGGKHVVVDSKVSLSAYLEAAEAADPEFQAARLAAHARHLRKHVDDLAGKSYWAQFTPAPEFVVLFVPGEAFLAPALEQQPALLEHAMAQRVIIATPTTLMTMLSTVAYAWQQAALTDNARRVFDLGRELYDRLGKLGEHVDKLGRSITRVVGDYNSTVGSLETRVLSSARKLKDLQVVAGELGFPGVLEGSVRPLGSPELTTAAEDARAIRHLPSPVDRELEAIVDDPRYGLTPDHDPAEDNETAADDAG